MNPSQAEHGARGRRPGAAPLAVTALLASLLLIRLQAPAGEAIQDAAAPDDGGMTGAAQNIEAGLRRLFENPLLKSAGISLEAVNLGTGARIAVINPGLPLNPASAIKIATSAAALDILGPAYQFETKIFADAPMSGGTVRGDLYFRGNGDPRLTSERIFLMASELRQAGLKSVTGGIVMDDSYFDSEREPRGWAKTRGEGAYYAGTGALSANFNSVAVNVLPGEPGGAAVVTVEPEIPYVKLINRVVTKKAGSRKVSVKIKSTAGGEEVTASGSIPAGDEGKTFYRRVGDPPVYCGNLIRETLGMLGMAVAGGVRTGAVPEKAVEIHIFKSERLAVLARDMNKSSNNFTAEQMIKAMGASRKTPGTFDEGLAAVSEFLERAGLGRGSYGMTNGSGLSHLSRFSSAQMVKILVYASSQFRWSPEFISSLSISAGDGTIRKRYKDTPAAGIVRAKTGTIDGVASLAGYLINASGDVVAFAIIINGFDPKRYREAADICDAAAVMLAET